MFEYGHVTRASFGESRGLSNGPAGVFDDPELGIVRAVFPLESIHERHQERIASVSFSEALRRANEAVQHCQAPTDKQALVRIFFLKRPTRFDKADIERVRCFFEDGLIEPVDAANPDQGWQLSARGVQVLKEGS